MGLELVSLFCFFHVLIIRRVLHLRVHWWSSEICLAMQGKQVWSLVTDIQSHMPSATTKDPALFSEDPACHDGGSTQSKISSKKWIFKRVKSALKIIIMLFPVSPSSVERSCRFLGEARVIILPHSECSHLHFHQMACVYSHCLSALLALGMLRL